VTAPEVAVAACSTGFSRAVTVELLLILNKPCYEKTTISGNLLYSAAVGSGCLPRGFLEGKSLTPPDDPGGYAKWVRCPHGPATVSGYAAPGPWAFVPGPWSATEHRLGKARAADSRRESGNLATGDVLVFRRGERRKEHTLSTGQPRAAMSWSGGKDSCAALHRKSPLFSSMRSTWKYEVRSTKSEVRADAAR
jgi:hypothetical protein